uniref:G-protein coupled receptors family 1 profile domain-containing protein n=1 Tax=Plectus sambesii TaxID=2011161 RepID=A0A914VM25_9BILA
MEERQLVNWTFTSVRAALLTSVTAAPPFTHQRHPNWFALFFLPLLSVLGFIGNLMVCIAIYTERRLQNVTNYFLFSLAVADLLVCALVMPLSIMVEVRNGVWTWSFSLCLLYVYADVFLCSASIVHMSVISLDRYLGISQPLKTRNKSRTMITLKIAAVWVITAIISSPMGALAIYDPINILHEDTCVITNRYFMIYGSTLSFLIPFVIMAVTYVRTTALLSQQAALLSQKADSATSEGLRRTMPNRKLSQYRQTSNKLRRFSQSQASTTTAPQHKTSVTLSYASLNMGNAASATTLCDMDDVERQLLARQSRRLHSGGERQLRVTATRMDRFRSRTTDMISALATRVGRPNSFQTASQELANEHKATRVLAVVFICFFICWTPFFGMNFTFGFCGVDCAVPAAIASTFLWLGYMSSTINPVIYTIFNRRFRETFLRILRCQCCHTLRDTAVYSRQATYISNGAVVPNIMHNASGGSLHDHRRAYNNSAQMVQMRSPVGGGEGDGGGGGETIEGSDVAQISPDMSTSSNRHEHSLDSLNRQLKATSNADMCQLSSSSRSPTPSYGTGGAPTIVMSPNVMSPSVMSPSVMSPMAKSPSTMSPSTMSPKRRPLGPYSAIAMSKSASATQFSAGSRQQANGTLRADLRIYLNEDVSSSVDKMALIAGHVLKNDSCKETFV